MANGRARLLGLAALLAATPFARRAEGQSALPSIPNRPDAFSATSAAAAEPLNANGADSLGRPGVTPLAPSIDPEELARPFAVFSWSAENLRDSLVSLARAQIGRRYRFGGTTPEHGFDCSGLVRYVMSALHISLPRTARDQAQSGTKLPRDTSQLQPGDLVTFGSTRRISHIGIYVGDGRFVQASSKAGRVIETPLYRRLVPGVKPWRGARRVPFNVDSTATLASPGGDG